MSSINPIGPEATEALLDVLVQETRDRKQERVGILAGSIGIGLGASIGIAWFLTSTSGVPTHWQDFAVLMGASFFSIFMGTAGILDFVSESRRRLQVSRWQHAVLALAQIQDIRAVGQLTTLLEHDDKTVRTLAAKGLTSLLPRLQADNAHLLDADRRACLYRMLTNSRVNQETDFVLSILQAVKVMGDVNALPQIKRLANKSGLTSQERQIQAEAQVCLSVLEAQRITDRESRTLVRSAGVGENQAETLLRAAKDSTQTNTQQRSISEQKNNDE